jgi:hypothetical protein
MLTWQALRGQPLLRPDAVTLGAFAALAVATVTATVAVLRAGVPADQAAATDRPPATVLR